MIKTLRAKNTMIASKDSLRNILIGIYILVVLAFSVTSRAAVEEIMPVFTDNTPVQAQEYTGELVKNTSNGAYFLFMSRSMYFEIKSNIDLESYVGHKVTVQAVRALYKVEPYYKPMNLDTGAQHPLVITDENSVPYQVKPSNILVILQINEIVE